MLRKLTAEMIGTFALVFAGAGAVTIDGLTHGGVTHVGVALTFGLVIMSVAYALGDVSGAYINPAVTLAAWAARRLPGRDVVPYLLAQAAGALLGAGALRLLFPASALLGSTMPAGSESQSFALEALLTLFLAFVVLNVTAGPKESRSLAPIAIGGVIALEAAFAGPITGASMNPARSLGPAVVSGHLEHLWLYLAAPTLGALVAVPLACIVRPGARGTEGTTAV